MTARRWSRGRRSRVAIGAAIGLASFAIALALFDPAAPRRAQDFAAWRAGPTDARAVYWIGHSLMNARDPFVDGAPNLIEAVGDIARAEGLRYRSFDHTYFGAPLSLSWTGAARTYERREPEALARRRAFGRTMRDYDTLVLTEGVPVGPTMRAEGGSYYAQRFACAAVAANPRVRIYVFESWTEYDTARELARRLEEDRPSWERLADEAASAQVPEPTRLARLSAWASPPDPECELPPIGLVPVGSALLAWIGAMAAAPEDWTREDGTRITVPSLFANAREDGRLAHPDAQEDAVHPSALMTYFTALVHYATLYRRRPSEAARGAMPYVGLTPETDARLRELVWVSVSTDERAGVGVE